MLLKILKGSLAPPPPHQLSFGSERKRVLDRNLECTVISKKLFIRIYALGYICS
jgi:hypothetical protein